MTAGKPNYQKLYDMGKLPENMRHTIPGLAHQDNLQKELNTINSVLCKDCKAKILELSIPKKEEAPKVAVLEKKNIKDSIFEAQKRTEEQKAAEETVKETGEIKVLCPGFQCEYIAVGKTEGRARNNLRLHQQGKHPDMFKGEEKK